MDRTELYLKTAFCCMACDGDIAQQELDTIKGLPLDLDKADLQQLLMDYVEQLKAIGNRFLRQFLGELKAAELTHDEEKRLVGIAVQTIEADQNIEYNEIAFFKKIRSCLKSTDEELLSAIPENPAVADQITPEDYLLPDMDSEDLSLWGDDCFKWGADILNSQFLSTM